MRVCYSFLIIVAHIKIMNVLSFYGSVAFLVKIMESMVGALLPFLGFIFFFLVMFAMTNVALDVTYLNSDIKERTGDYTGLFGMAGAHLMMTFRQSLGDFNLDTFKFLPAP